MTTTTRLADLFIDGAWRVGESGDRFSVTDPATGDVLARFAVASVGDCVAAVDAAAAAQAQWAATAPRVRSELLSETFRVLRGRREELVETMVLENGKAWSDAEAETDYAIEFFRWFAEEAVRIPGDYRVSPAGDKRIVVSHAPVGVSLLITPWNFPAAMAARKLAPALAAGCASVLKPATETPLTAALIVEALREAGCPPGVVNLVTPVPTAPAVAAMMAHAAVRKISFTGSTEVGRVLLAQAADRVLATSMELGGNAPLIVLPGADLDLAVEGALLAKLRNGGSACTSANRLYVHDSLHDAFTARLSAAFARLTVGPGTDRANAVGALVSTRERDKVARLVETAVAEGARIVQGGAVQDGGAFFEPTLLVDVAHGATINRTEIFGPVAAVVRYRDVDDVVRMANDTEFGLVAYVFGPTDDALAVAERLDAGMVGVNRGVVSDPAAPFGGVKQSGLGREGGTEGILEFLETKYIALPAPRR